MTVLSDPALELASTMAEGLPPPAIGPDTRCNTPQMLHLLGAPDPAGRRAALVQLATAIVATESAAHALAFPPSAASIETVTHLVVQGFIRRSLKDALKDLRPNSVGRHVALGLAGAARELCDELPPTRSASLTRAAHEAFARGLRSDQHAFRRWPSSIIADLHFSAALHALHNEFGSWAYLNTILTLSAASKGPRGSEVMAEGFRFLLRALLQQADGGIEHCVPAAFYAAASIVAPNCNHQQLAARVMSALKVASPNRGARK